MPAKPWVDISPWRNLPLDVMPIPPPIKHMKHVRDMAKNRKPLVDVTRRGT
jgi:hypothetical protein